MATTITPKNTIVLTIECVQDLLDSLHAAICVTRHFKNPKKRVFVDMVRLK